GARHRSRRRDRRRGRAADAVPGRLRRRRAGAHGRRAVRADVRDGRHPAQHPDPPADARTARGRLRVRPARYDGLPHRRRRLTAGGRRGRGHGRPDGRRPTGRRAGGDGLLPGNVPSVERADGSEGRGHLSTPRLRHGTPERAGLDAGELRHLVREVHARTDGARPWAAGAVVVVGRGPVLAVREAAGWAVRHAAHDEETDTPVELPPSARVPMTVDTPFDLASLTKLFTSVAAVQQIERGTLGIDARVGAYLPDFTAAVRHGITVRQLLTHTSGLRPELPLYAC